MAKYRDENFDNRIVMTHEQYAGLYRRRIGINTQINKLLYKIFEEQFTIYHSQNEFIFVDNSSHFRTIVRRYTLQTQASENYIGYLLNRSFVDDIIVVESYSWKNFDETAAVWNYLKGALAVFDEKFDLFNKIRLILRVSNHKLAAALDHSVAYKSDLNIHKVGLAYRRAPVTFTKSHDEDEESFNRDAQTLAIRDLIARIYFECECNILSLVHAYVKIGKESDEYSTLVFGAQDRLSDQINDYKKEATTKIAEFRESKGWSQVADCDLDFFVECGAFLNHSLNDDYISYIVNKYAKNVMTSNHFSQEEIDVANDIIKMRSELTVKKAPRHSMKGNLLSLPLIAVLNFPDGAYFDLHNQINKITIADICCASVAWAVYRKSITFNHRKNNISLAGFIRNAYL